MLIYSNVDIHKCRYPNVDDHILKCRYQYTQMLIYTKVDIHKCRYPNVDVDILKCRYQYTQMLIYSKVDIHKCRYTNVDTNVLLPLLSLSFLLNSRHINNFNFIGGGVKLCGVELLGVGVLPTHNFG